MLPAGRLRLSTRPSFTGSEPTLKTMGIVLVAALAASAAVALPGVAMTATWRCTSFGHQCRHALDLILCPTIFDYNIAAIDETGFAEALTKCRGEMGASIGG